MEQMIDKKRFILVATLLMCWLGLHAQPKLVVGIVVDQMRWDYLERYQNRYVQGGFNRLMRDGYNCTQCMINYLPAVTAVGHTSVYTGTVPAYSGIVDNNFYLDGCSTYCCSDSTVRTVGSTSSYGKMSPRNLLPTTMTDELRLANNFRGKVIGVAVKDRSSILPAGHSANAAYWLDGDKNDVFISSTYYMNELPQWAKDFNAKGLAAKYMQRGWPAKLMYADSTYVQSHPRDQRIEFSVGEEIRTTPWGATLTLDMARAAIDGEQLGADDITDFLAISISSTDAIAHCTGPNSPYIEDAFLWLDKDLESFFKYLDKKVGKGKWTAFLTADHAGQHNPQFREDHNLPSTVWEVGYEVAKLNKLLTDSLGREGKYILGVTNFKMRLDEEVIKAAGSTRKQCADIICGYLRQLPQVSYAFDIEDIPDYVPEPLPTMLRNGYNPRRSGQIQIVPAPGVMEPYSYGTQNKKGVSHSLWTPDDTHIPCVFYGYGVPKGKRDNRVVHIVDIAPTICSLLHIQQPSACVGEPIF